MSAGGQPYCSSIDIRIAPSLARTSSDELALCALRNLYDRPEPLARDADQLAAEADLVTLALVLDRDRLMRAAVGGTATRCHSRSTSSSSSTSTIGAGSLRRDGGS